MRLMRRKMRYKRTILFWTPIPSSIHSVDRKYFFQEDEIVPVETRRVQKRQRVVVEEEEEQGEEMQRQVQKRPRQLLEEVEAAGKWCRFM